MPLKRPGEKFAFGKDSSRVDFFTAVTLITGRSFDLGIPEFTLNILADPLGHFSTKTTEIYLEAVGTEKRKMVMNVWK